MAEKITGKWLLDFAELCRGIDDPLDKLEVCDVAAEKLNRRSGATSENRADESTIKYQLPYTPPINIEKYFKEEPYRIVVNQGFAEAYRETMAALACTCGEGTTVHYPDCPARPRNLQARIAAGVLGCAASEVTKVELEDATNSIAVYLSNGDRRLISASLWNSV